MEQLILIMCNALQGASNESDVMQRLKQVGLPYHYRFITMRGKWDHEVEGSQNAARPDTPHNSIFPFSTHIFIGYTRIQEVGKSQP